MVTFFLMQPSISLTEEDINYVYKQYDLVMKWNCNKLQARLMQDIVRIHNGYHKLEKWSEKILKAEWKDELKDLCLGGKRYRKSYRRPVKEKIMLIGDDNLNKSQQHHMLTKRHSCHPRIYEENQEMYKEKFQLHNRQNYLTILGKY